jgi:hypothetical protein
LALARVALTGIAERFHQVEEAAHEGDVSALLEADDVLGNRKTASMGGIET